MTDSLAEFFNAAQETAAPLLERQQAEYLAAEERRNKNDRAFKKLGGKIVEELGGILDVLKGLPPDDGQRKFIIRTTQGGENSGTYSYKIELAYINPALEKHLVEQWERATGPREQPRVVIELSMKDDAFGAAVTRKFEPQPKQSFGDDYARKYFSSDVFSHLRAELGVAVATIATDRLPEIGTAIGATPKKAVVPQQPLRV